MKSKNIDIAVQESYFKSVELMIWSIIHTFNGISEEDKKDLFQEASIFLVQDVIGKYDDSKNVKFKDFAFVCLKNFILRKVNNLNKNSRFIIADSELLQTLPEAKRETKYFSSDKLSEIKKLLDSDSDKLKENEKVVLTMIFENPKITQREMAERMGFSFASGVGAILSRFRKRLENGEILEDN